MPKGEKELRQVIKGDLLTQINEIWRKGKAYQDSQQGDNIQGTLHCEAVEKNLSKLIPDEKKEKELKPIEIFVLSAAACLHDIGKVVNDVARGWKSDHGKRSMEIILEEYDKLGLERGQAFAVGHVVSVHGDARLDELPRTPVVGSEEINIIKLAAIFRLADMLDTNYQRAPEIVSSIKFPHGDVPSKWKGRQSITGWYLDEKDRIVLQAIPKEDEIDSSYTLKAMMNEDLAKISPYLKLYGFPSELGELDIGDIFIKSHLKDKAKIKRPFPGMAFYTKEDMKIFKGREKEIEDLLTVVSNWPITLLIGESGAGKTSLIHAGLFPKLDTMMWKYVWTRPFDNPEENIKKMIWPEFFEGTVDEKKSLLDVMKLAAEKCKPYQLLIVMDQFEDILNCSVQEILEEFCFHLISVQAGTVIPNLRILISFREDALIKLNSRLLKKITGSAQQFPSVELERLTRDGAKNALLAGLENAGIGLDPRIEKGQRPLIKIILDDIQKGDDRLYPPYIQMVAETLCRKADPIKPIITRDIYFDQLKSADNIIARYLIERLIEFGPQRNKAEKVLIFLTSSQGKKAQKSLLELSRETEIEMDELKSVIKKMVDLRMARAASEDEFEIIHDYFGKIVDEELVQEEDRTIKFLEEQLESYYQNYKAHGTPIMSPPFMANLYRYRRRIKISEEKYPLILCTCLNEEMKMSLGWYWLKDIEKSQMLEMLKTYISHGKEDIRYEAVDGFASLAAPEDKENIFDMMINEDVHIRLAAVKALGNIATPKDREKIIEMLKDENYDVRRKAKEAFVKIATQKDMEKIIDMMNDENYYMQQEAGEAFVKIVTVEDMEKILDMLKDKNYNIKLAAANAFVKIATPEDREKIIDMLKDKDCDVRKVAVKALGNIATPEDRDKIINMLKDEDKYVRKAAAKAFEKITTLKDRELIIKMLKDSYSDVRQAAVMALGKMVTPEDREMLIEMVKDEDRDVRFNVLMEFFKIATLEDRGKVIEMLEDEDHSIRLMAIKIFIIKITTPKDRGIIIELLKDEDINVREFSATWFIYISTPEYREMIIEMTNNEDINVKKAGVYAFLKISGPGDQEYLLDQLAEQCQGWSEDQLEIFELLSEVDKRLYCPYYEEENDN
jgi:HEAT repeat protein